MNSDKAKGITENVRNEIKLSEGTRIWDDYVNALKLIAQVVFTRSSGFILELIQNAEDAGLGLKYSGIFEIKINQHRVKVIHNGRPFTEMNVKALCGIRSSKKPEKGTLGYLGIGFKSVFKVTDCPEIYSGGFQFKYDRDYPDWKDPSNTPWHVLPIWIDKPSEAVDQNKTTFIIPFRDKAYYQPLVQEVEKLKTELYLFLRWLKRIEVTDEETGRTWVLENIGESIEGIITLKQGNQEQKFRLFHRTLEVPDWVKQDRMTQEYRANVTHREIAIAFALDGQSNLAPTQAGAMYGGVYSFLPLGEAKSGARFPIQADFLVQPGRDAINYESKWNQWLVEEVASLCKEAIDCFKKHDKWKYQFLPAFQFTKSEGLESYDKLFGPKLIEPIEKFLNEDECIPTIEGGLAKLQQLVRLNEETAAIEDLSAMNILKKDEVASILGGHDGLQLVHPAVQEPYPVIIRKLDRQALLENAAYLEQRCKQPNAANWFRSLYLWLTKHPLSSKSGRTRVVRRYHDVEFVLTADGRLSKGGGVLLPDLLPSDPILKSLSETLQKSRAILHPDILAGANDEKEREAIRGFLTGFTGVQKLDSKAVCKEALLPQILTTAPKPSKDDLLKYTAYCQTIIGDQIPGDSKFWVLTKREEVRPAEEVLFPVEFKPEQDWETNKQYVPGLNFVSTDYITGVTDSVQLHLWRQFFKAGGVKDTPNSGVEVFAMNYAVEKLKTKYKSVIPVEKLNFGYDMVVETQSGEKMFVEVKGQSHDQDVELKDNEAEAAETHKDSFHLCIVASIPEKPTIYMVKNPAKVVKIMKIVLPIKIPPSVWKKEIWNP